MAMKVDEPVTAFEQWYEQISVSERTGCVENFALSKEASELMHAWTFSKREMDQRVGNYEKLEKLADAQVISPKPDLPNISSGETAGFVRRIARNVVQHAPMCEVISKFDDDEAKGIFTKHILSTKIIGDDQYSNDMQQNLFASVKMSLTLGFDCVIPTLLQDAGGSWYMKYDNIHYRDVFPEPGAKDVRQATNVFIRRYLTRGEAARLVNDNTAGWDIPALRTMLQQRPPAREAQSVDHQTKKRGITPEGYEIITWYSDTGAPFLTFNGTTKLLLRVEKNKHPLKKHPVFFLIMEKDSQQPLGKSQVELILGRQDFQDLMLNGAMKMWYRNINPSIMGFGAGNALPNLGPGKYTNIANPNARVEPFEVNTQTLMQYSAIAQQNLGSMVTMIGAADQQMAQQSGNGMSATPQGVEAQQTMVDITTNNYQKAVESFFSHYCSYALTVYFHELKGVTQVEPTADTRLKLEGAGIPLESFEPDGSLKMDFSTLATEYWVKCVPGSLVEMEDEKQLRILNELFVPLSQAMPALAASQNPEIVQQAAQAMQFIITKEIQLSGSDHARELSELFTTGKTPESEDRAARADQVEAVINDLDVQVAGQFEQHESALATMQEQISLLIENQQLLHDKLGVSGNTSEQSEPAPADPALQSQQQDPNVMPVPA